MRKAAELRKFLEIENDYFVTYTEDYNVFENRLEDYDLILLNSKLNRLTDPQYFGLLDAVKNGMPLLAIHGASASFRNTSPIDRPEYYKMIGAKFDHHPKIHKFKLHLHKDNGLLDASFANYSVIDELYYYSQFENDNKVLLYAKYLDEVITYGLGKRLWKRARILHSAWTQSSS